MWQQMPPVGNRASLLPELLPEFGVARERGTVRREKKTEKEKKKKKKDADNGRDRRVYSGLIAGENRRGKPHLDFTGDRRIRTTLTCQNVNRSVKPSRLGLFPESSK